MAEKSTIRILLKIFLILIINSFTLNANILDSLQSLLNGSLTDSGRFEVYNQIFPIIVKQNIDSAEKCLDIQNKILKQSVFNKDLYNEFLIDIYNNSGILYNRKGKQDSAIIFHDKALKLAVKTDKQRVQGITLNNIANIYYLQGNYKASLEYHLKALKIRKEIGDTNGIAMSYGNIGLIHSSLKKYKKCIEYYSNAKKMFEAQNNKHAISWAYRAIGVAYLDLKQYSKALTNLNKSLNICYEIEDLSGEKYNLLNKGIVYLGMFEETKNKRYLDSADMVYNRVYELQQKSYIKRIDINYLNYKAQILIFRKQYNKAISLLNKSEKLLSEIELKNELKSVYEFKSEAYESVGNYKLALDNYKKFKNITDSLFTIEKEKEIGRKEAEFEYNEKLKIAKINNENKLKLEKAEKERLKLWLIIIILLTFVIVISLVFIYRKLTKEKRLLNQQKIQILKKYANIEEAYNEAVANIEELKIQQKYSPKKHKPLPNWINVLSKRETEVLSCIAIGMTDKEIEDKLFISVTTVRTHCQRIYAKLLVKNRIEAANLAREYNLI